MLKNNEKTRKIRVNSKLNNTPPAFLLKTYEILENPEYEEIISWNYEGDAFIVKKQNEFAERILPKFFKHNNFQSFVRQLNMYDFHKSRQENHENIFKHALFKRGHKDLLKNIKRKATFDSITPSTISLLPKTHMAPMITANGQEFDVERYNKDYNVFMQELISLKNKQDDLQQIITILIQQNNEILSENKILWSELLKNRDKKDKKFDKFIQTVMHLFLNSNASLPQLQTSPAGEVPKSQENDSQILNENLSKNITFLKNSKEFLNNNTEIGTNTEKMSALCNFIEDKEKTQDQKNEKLLKKLMKKLKPAEAEDSQGSEYKLSSFLDNYYDKNLNVLQNLMKFLNNNDKNTDICSKILGKRSAPAYNFTNSLKYLDDSVFTKKKKLKKMKIKKEEPGNSFYIPSPNGYPEFNAYNNFLKKENLLDSPSNNPLKMEQHPPFPAYFNQNKMLTNYPNNPSPQTLFPTGQTPSHFSLFSNNNQGNHHQNIANDYYNELMMPYNQNNLNNNTLMNSPFYGDNGLNLSRKNSALQNEMAEDFENILQNQYNFNQPLNLESPMISSNFNQGFTPFANRNSHSYKEEDLEDKKSVISLNLDKLDA